MFLTKKQSAWQSGKRAETIACWWLRIHGYRIIARRLRTPCAEIDIVARRGWWNRQTVIVEVKFRPESRLAVEALTVKQRQRLQRAGLWLQSQGYMRKHETLRFDYIAIAPLFSRGWIHHFKNITL